MPRILILRKSLSFYLCVDLCISSLDIAFLLFLLVKHYNLRLSLSGFYGALVVVKWEIIMLIEFSLKQSLKCFV